jgi:hypothetical protein
MASLVPAAFSLRREVTSLVAAASSLSREVASLGAGVAVEAATTSMPSVLQAPEVPVCVHVNPCVAPGEVTSSPKPACVLLAVCHRVF